MISSREGLAGGPCPIPTCTIAAMAGSQRFTFIYRKKQRRAWVEIAGLTVTFEVAPESCWFAGLVQPLLRAVVEAPCAGHITSLAFAALEDDRTHSVDAFTALPAEDFARLTALTDLRLDSGLVSVSGGPGLRHLRRLSRTMGEIAEGELGALGAARFEALEELVVESEFVVLAPRDDAPSREVVVKLRRSTAEFASGNAFPALKRLALKSREHGTRGWGECGRPSRRRVLRPSWRGSTWRWWATADGPRGPGRGRA